MARKPAVSYAGLALDTDRQASTVVPVTASPPTSERQPRKVSGRTLKEASAHVMLYLHPAAVKTLKRYALDQNVKVHDLLIEAVENWFQAHGLKERVRADTARKPANT